MSKLMLWVIIEKGSDGRFLDWIKDMLGWM